jgi:lysophospholipid acyltransferase (LPLAT)-like uncharacterized protein
MIKTALKFKILRSILGLISGTYFTLLGRTIRWHKLDGDGLSGQISPGGTGIIVLWHSRLIAVPHIIGREYRPNVLISRSRDGRIIKTYGIINGVRIIDGSSSRGGVSAYKKMRRELDLGCYIVMTPDGPRGPARQATVSVIHLAAKSGQPIIPFSYSASPMKRYITWDRLVMPKWFSRAAYAFGDPIYINPNPGKAEIETAVYALEDALNLVTSECDGTFGYPPEHIPHRYGDSR